MSFAGISRAALLVGILAPSAGAALAQETKAADSDTVFVLGRIENGITSTDGETISAASVDEEQLRKFDRTSVDEALDLVAGANASNTDRDVIDAGQSAALLPDRPVRAVQPCGQLGRVAQCVGSLQRKEHH